VTAERPPRRSTAELAASAGVTEKAMRRLLLQEVKRGHVEQVDVDRWRATPKLLALLDGAAGLRQFALAA